VRISDWSSDGCSSDLSCPAGSAQPGCCSIRCRSLRQCHGRSARPPSPPARPSPALALHRDPAMRAMIPSGSCVGPPLPRCLHVYMLACPLVKLAHLIGRLAARLDLHRRLALGRSEEHTSELQSLMRISYAVFCLKKKTKPNLISITPYNKPNSQTLKPVQTIYYRT